MSRNLMPLALAALAVAGMARADVPSIAVDIAPVHSLVARVMEGVGSPALIVPSGASPHGHTLKPSEAKALQDAEIVFWIGPELTPWLGDTIETLAPDALVIGLLAAPGTTGLAQRGDAIFEPHDHGTAEDHGPDEADHDDRDQDEHGHEGHSPGLDPHAWLDPGNAKVWLDVIATALSNADPAHEDSYLANAAAGNAEIDMLVGDVSVILDPVRDRSFIVFHDAYQYFESAFDFPASGAISLSDAAKPGPARIEEIRNRVDSTDVTCVLAEPQFNPDLVDTVLDGTEAQSAVVDPLGSGLSPGPTLYPQLLRELAQTLAGCL